MHNPLTEQRLLGSYCAERKPSSSGCLTITLRGGPRVLSATVTEFPTGVDVVVECSAGRKQLTPDEITGAELKALQSQGISVDGRTGWLVYN